LLEVQMEAPPASRQEELRVADGGRTRPEVDAGDARSEQVRRSFGHGGDPDGELESGAPPRLFVLAYERVRARDGRAVCRHARLQAERPRTPHVLLNEDGAAAGVSALPSLGEA